MLLADPSLTTEYIVEEATDWWVCKCGNQPNYEGFFTCSVIGEYCEPTIEEWDGKHYLCDKCFRIIDGDTLAVVGRCSQDVINKNEEYRWH